MSIEVRDRALLKDMQDASENIQKFIAGINLEHYKQDILLQSAVERQLEIIGEAAKKISATVQHNNPAIPWRGIIGQRNVLAHGYGSIDDEKIWIIASVRVPELIQQIEKILV